MSRNEIYSEPNYSADVANLQTKRQSDKLIRYFFNRPVIKDKKDRSVAKSIFFRFLYSVCRTRFDLVRPFYKRGNPNSFRMGI